jgi:hypothetical protein
MQQQTWKATSSLFKPALDSIARKNRFKSLLLTLGLEETYSTWKYSDITTTLQSLSSSFLAADYYQERRFKESYEHAMGAIQHISYKQLQDKEKKFALVAALYINKKMITLLNSSSDSMPVLQKNICYILNSLVAKGIPENPHLISEIQALVKEDCFYTYATRNAVPQILINKSAPCCLGSLYAFGHLNTFGWIEYMKSDLQRYDLMGIPLPHCKYIAPSEEYIANKTILAALGKKLVISIDPEKYISAVTADPNAESYLHINYIGKDIVDEFTYISWLHLVYHENHIILPSLYDNMNITLNEEEQFLLDNGLSRHEYYAVHFRDGGFKNERLGKDPLRSIDQGQASSILSHLSESGKPIVLIGESRSIEAFKDLPSIKVCGGGERVQFLTMKLAHSCYLNASGVMNCGQTIGSPTLLINSMPTIPYYSPWTLEIPKKIATKNGTILGTKDIVRLGMAGSDLGTVNSSYQLLGGKVSVIELDHEKIKLAIDNFVARVDSWRGSNKDPYPFQLKHANELLKTNGIIKFREALLSANVL